MTRNQRFGFLALAALILVGAVLVLQTGGDDDAEPVAETAATATPEPTATPAAEGAEPEAAPEPTPEPTPDPGPLLTAGKIREITVNKGERVRFRARAAEAEEVHVHGYDISKSLAAGRTEQISFKADIEGIFEIELEHSGTPIAELRVEP